MKRKTRFLLIVVIVSLLFTVTGCSILKTPEEKQGSLKVAVQIPTHFKLNSEIQSILDDIQLGIVKISLSNKVDTFYQEVSVESSIASVVFDKLQKGEWEITVNIADVNGFDIYSGKSIAMVGKGLTDVTIQLNVVKADLGMQIQLPEGVAQGTVKLINPQGNLENEMQISQGIGEVFFHQISPMTWPLKIELFDSSGNMIASDQAELDILPGRKNTVNVNMMKGFKISFVWETLPDEPEGLKAESDGSKVILTWNASPNGQAEGYYIYRSNLATGQKSLIHDQLIRELKFVDTNVEGEATYSYWVQAYDSKGYSSKLSEPCVVTISTIVNQERKIVFDSELDGIFQIYIMNPDGSQLTRLTRDTLMSVGPKCSPDGTKIAYTVYDSNYNGAIKVMNIDGSNNLLLSNGLKANGPEWASDGRKIAFTGNLDNRRFIYTANADGSNMVKLAEGFNPSWSPDNTKITYVSECSGNSEIYVMNADGTDVTRLTYNTESDYWPRWSPDGAKIAFQTEVGPWLFNLYVMNPDGSGAKLLKENSWEEPVWSPDGKEIVCSSDKWGCNMNADIWRINVETGEKIELMCTDDREGSPSWSPDGKQIAFQRADFMGVTEIYTINADGTNITQLTTNIVMDRLPQWVTVNLP